MERRMDSSSSVEYAGQIYKATQQFVSSLSSVLDTLNNSVQILSANEGGRRLESAVIELDRAQNELAEKLENTKLNLA